MFFWRFSRDSRPVLLSWIGCFLIYVIRFSHEVFYGPQGCFSYVLLSYLVFENLSKFRPAEHFISNPNLVNMGRFPICSICIESMGDFSDVGCCPCGHAFHHRCLIEWTKQSARAACPTCMTRFDNSPPGSCIKKLYFAFDKDSKAVEFSNEYLAQQMDLNEGLEAQVRERNVEIERLKQQLTQMEAAMAQEKDLAKKALDERESNLKMMTEFKEMATKLWRTEEAGRVKSDEMLKSERENLKQAENLSDSVKQENTTLKAQIEELRKLNDNLKEQIPISSRHVIITNLDSDTNKDTICVRKPSSTSPIR